MTYDKQVTSPKNKTNQRLKLLTFPSLASITLAACGGGPIVQPPEHSMVTVDLVADLPFMDDYNPMLDHDMLFWSSELG